MSKNNENNDNLDYSSFYYKNYKDDGSHTPDNKYYVSVRSGGSESIMLTALEPDEIDNEPYQAAHTVEYVSRNEKPSPHNEPRKKKGKRLGGWRNRGLVLVILTIVICFISTLLIADAVSGGYILDDLQATLTGKSALEHTYYAVEMINFTDMNSARVYSQELRSLGGAGYVINDTLFRVISEVYAEKSDADKVCAKLNTSGYMARIYEIKIVEIEYKLLPNSTRNLTKKVMHYAPETNGTLYKLGANLAANTADTNKTVSDLKALRATLSATLIDYESNCDDEKDNDYVYKIRMQLSTVISSIDNLCNSKDTVVGLLADIRYTNVMMLNTHRALCSDIQKVKE